MRSHVIFIIQIQSRPTVYERLRCCLTWVLTEFEVRLVLVTCVVLDHPSRAYIIEERDSQKMPEEPQSDLLDRIFWRTEWWTLLLYSIYLFVHKEASRRAIQYSIPIRYLSCLALPELTTYYKYVFSSSLSREVEANEYVWIKV